MRTFFKWNEPSRVEIAMKRQAERAKQETAVYRTVDRRDGFRCRCCGLRTDQYAIGLLRGEHHHVVYRSAGGETTTANVCLLCAGCHVDEHRHRLRIDGNADTGLTFWWRDRDHEEYVIRRELAVRQWEKD